MYQVFPDRFARSAAAERTPRRSGPSPATGTNPSGTGPDVPASSTAGTSTACTEKLDHLAALGVDIVYLTPFFPAASNHRYDASSFATWIRCWAATRRWPARRGGPRPRHEGHGRPHDQPLRRRARMVPRALADPASAEAEYFFFSADHTRLRVVVGRAVAAQVQLGLARAARSAVTGADSVVARWLRAPQPGRLADRRGQHDRPARRAGHEPGGGGGDPGQRGRRSIRKPCCSGRTPPTPAPTSTGPAGRGP